ncbi:MAG: group II intron reverse transcriptase/maturase [Erysipelothrix sp.]|nr:group II intron reverse transcriptase/maturase [Erysipelothrix sp.]
MRKWYSIIDKIYNENNLKEAFRSVKRNHGAPGIDGETVEVFAMHLEENIEFLHQSLKTKSYLPSPVKRVEIEKPDGGIRLLGIPTVKDRVVQQAVVNIIEPLFDPQFHPSSYGYRPNKSQHQAVAKADLFLKKGKLEHVVDMDLSKCFDTLDHDIMMQEVSQTISDGQVLSLIESFLKSGIMVDGAYESSEIGSPQGGVISPLLSNIYLNIFDQRIKQNGNYRMVRYADDILIFTKSKRDAHNAKAWATQILEEELKLTVNQEKTQITSLKEGVSFLGFTLLSYATVIDRKRIKRFKDNIRRLTKRNIGIPMSIVISRLNRFLRGWINYYRIANIKSFCINNMKWIRRRLRMIRMKQWKTHKAMHKEMRRLVIHNDEKMNVTLWKNSKVKIIHQTIPNSWFDKMKLINLTHYEVGLLSNNKIKLDT